MGSVGRQRPMEDDQVDVLRKTLNGKRKMLIIADGFVVRLSIPSRPMTSFGRCLADASSCMSIPASMHYELLSGSVARNLGT